MGKNTSAERFIIMTKRKKRRSANSFLKGLLISLLMVFAALSGIYAAKIYTTPYSSIVSEFEAGTLHEVEIAKEKCNILILGTDKEGLRTDVMMLAQIDPQTDHAVVMSIPRDTRVKYAGVSRKITEVHSVGHRKDKKGSEAAIIAVKQLTGIPVHHFVKVNFEAFRDSIDELGGVEFDVPQRMKYKDPYQDLNIDLQPGMQHLDGDKSEQLLRFRRYKNGDLDRIKVQQDFIHALAEQKLQMRYIGKIDDIYRIISDNMETSMTPGDAVQCAMQMLSIGTDKIETITMPGVPQDIGGGSYVIPDYSGIDEVRKTSFGYSEEDEI